MGPLIIKSAKPSILSDLTDIELFELMKNRDSNHNSAKHAWEEFYKRYARYLWNCCLNQCKSLPDGESVALDIFQGTMQKIYGRAELFDVKRNSGIKGWISRVSQNEFHNYFNKYHLNFTNDQPEDIEDEVEIENNNEIDEELATKIETIKFDQLKLLLSKLNEKEYKILITCMSYYQMDKPNTHLPDNEIEKLCKEFNIKPASIRQIKRRALLKLQKFAQNLL